MWAIAQTSDGFLWLQSSSGDLYRFDGIRFLPLSLPSKGGSVHRVKNLFGDHAGALWLQGGLETDRLKDGIVSGFKLKGLGVLQSFSEDPDGSLWVLNDVLDEPLCHVTGQATRCFGKSDGIPISPLNSLLRDGNGGFWLGGETTLVHWHSGASEIYPIKGLKSNLGQEGVVSLAKDARGSLWVGILDSGPGLGLARLIGGSVQSFVTPTFNGSEVTVNNMVFDHDGSLWVASDAKGVFRIHDNVVEHYGHADGLSSDSVSAVFEDREGIVWAVTSNGVDSFRDPWVTTFSASEGLGKDEGARGILATRDGTVWVANLGSLDHIVNGAVTSIRTGHGLPGNQVTAMLEDHAGNMWVGVDDELYLFKNGRFRRLAQPNHKALGYVDAITEDSAGNIWAECRGKPGRLVRIRDFQLREEFSAPQLPYGRAIAPDPHGGIWISNNKGYVTLFRSGMIETQFPLNPGGEQLSKQIIAQADGSVLAGSENGLVGWRMGRVQRLTTKNGLPCDRVEFFVEDKQKRWWLYTSCGVVELADSELQRWWANPAAIVQKQVYDVFDGAQPPIYPNSNSVAYSPDGHVWFANGSIVQMIDPSRLSQKALPAMTYIQSVTVDHKEFRPTEGLNLPPHPRDVQIDYTSPTFLIPQKVRFRYLLTPYDHDWNEAGARRQAFYTDLPPGKFSFRVIASNSDGVWSNNVATFDFSIAPAYYQMMWFRALCAAMLLALLWAAYQLRMRRLHQQFSITLEARVAERTRIARELHDTLLQGAHGLLLHFETVSQLLPDRPGEAKESLDHAIRQTAEFVTEARDEVQGLRDSTVKSNNLAMAINMLGEELARSATNERPPVFQVTVEGEARVLHPIIRDEIYKISAEALRNAFRHSQAHRIEVEIRYDNEQLRLRVRDDGKGMDAATLSTQGREGHFGLSGLRERATLIGGKLAIWSEVDSGTEIELRIPAAVAYVTKQRRSWWSRKPNV